MSFLWWFYTDSAHGFPSSSRQSRIIKLKLRFSYSFAFFFFLDKCLVASGSAHLLSAAGVVTAWRTGVDFSWCSVFLLSLVKVMGKLPLFLVALTLLNGIWKGEDVFYCRTGLFHTFLNTIVAVDWLSIVFFAWPF